MIYKQNGKILVTNGKLAASENCCCGVGFCCYCAGPRYYFLEAPRGEPNNFNICRRSFGGIYFSETNGESLNTWVKIWRNDSNFNQIWSTVEEGSQFVPPGYTHYITYCYSPTFRCEMVKAMQLGSFSNENGEPYIINGPEDLQNAPGGGFSFPYLTEWIKDTSSGETGRSAWCDENISRLDCEKCTRIEDVIDLDIPGRNKVTMLGIDRCGTFVPPLSSNTICRPLPPAYDTNDLDNCVITVECINGVPYYNGSPGVPPLFTGCDVCGNDYYINGQVTTLDCNGNGCWNNVSYWNGSSSAPNNFTGCDYCGNFYYINGEVTTLDCDGSGCWNGIYYINLEETTLDCDGSGCWNGIIYYNGSVGVDPSFSGYSDCDGVYYINGQPTTLDSSGNGCWNDVYYINGELTTLDCDGSGCWNGILYENGVNIGEC